MKEKFRLQCDSLYGSMHKPNLKIDPETKKKEEAENHVKRE